MTTTKVQKLFELFVVCGFVLFVVVLMSLIAEATTDAQIQQPPAAVKEWKVENNNFTKIDQVIKTGLDECSDLETSSCLGVMYSLDNICQVAYFPSCFNGGDGANEWDNFMNHLHYRIQSGDYPDKGYEDDPYLTLNNHHFGSE